jgi:hypothetical protein
VLYKQKGVPYVSIKSNSSELIDVICTARILVDGYASPSKHYMQNTLLHYGENKAVCIV